MKLIKAVNAYMAMSILSKEKMKFKDALNLTMAKNKLKESYEFFASQEKDIVLSTCKKDNNGVPIKFSDGHFEFENEEARNKYKKDMEELSSIEIPEKDYLTVVISPPPTISVELIEALDGFVFFEEAPSEGAS